ncbi:MAG: 50S ribosomal protein L16 [Candidatus Moranbacteria bacterium]|nr:50S ribosomal protein L16 [Candidatus Moranbacteria bacterium]
MLIPKKVKYRKWQTGRKDMAKASPDTRGTDVSFGSFGLKATTGGRIRSNQIEAARKVTSRTIGKIGRMWIRIFPDRPFTQKAANVGMGKGKGDPEGYCLYIRPGRIIFEVDGVPEATAKEALRKAGTKLPVSTRVIAR